MTDNTAVRGERRQARSGIRQLSAKEIVLPVAIVFVGGVAIALFHLLSVRSFAYPYLFAASAMLAFTAGLSAPASLARPPWGANSVWAATATVCFAGLLAALALLYIAFDVELFGEFCDPVPGNIGDRKIDDNDYCSYAYGQMATYFLSFFVGAVAPYVEFAVLFAAIRAVRHRVALKPNNRQDP